MWPFLYLDLVCACFDKPSENVPMLRKSKLHGKKASRSNRLLIVRKSDIFHDQSK